MPTEREILVYDDTSPIRLDRFLVDRLRGLSRAYVAELIALGIVTVNGKKCRKGVTLGRGDRVEVEPFQRPEERRIDPNPDIPVTIVWQSPQMLVVDKPAGLPTHPNDFTDKETLANALVGRFPGLVEVGEDPLRPGIVHRLDTDTSGLLAVARTQEAFRHLRQQFDERKVKKTYLALVLGEVSAKGEVVTPLAHHATNPRKMVAVPPEGTGKIPHRSKVREAGTAYEPVERFIGYTLLRVRTKTGRMHQVRVHLSSIGHPLAGDRLYQTPKERQIDRIRLDRHFLHAHKLELEVLPNNSFKSFDSNLPNELEFALAELRAEG
ncbi:MAG: RluA family pseudouridine synthase [Pseudomonadota bacterium]